MKRVNVGRVLLGGIVAAVVLFIVGGVVNGALLGNRVIPVKDRKG